MIAQKDYTELIKEFLQKKNIRPSKINLINEEGFTMIVVRIPDLQMNKAIDLSCEATEELLKELKENIAVSIIPL